MTDPTAGPHASHDPSDPGEASDPDRPDGADTVDPAGSDAEAGEAQPGAGNEVGAAEAAAAEASPDDTFDLQLIDPGELVAALEAILFVVDSPVTVAALAAALEQPVSVVEQALAALGAGYHERGAGIELREVAGGVRLYTRTEHAGAVEQFLLEGQRTRLSQAALETLAVIAYRQPVTRQRVSAIRGVNVDGVVRTLLARGLVVEDGADPDTGGGLFRTSELFLERMGLQSLDELPSLAPLLPEVEGLDTDLDLDEPLAEVGRSVGADEP